MKFPTTFKRFKGGGGTALGSDVVPTVAPGQLGTAGVATDCLGSYRYQNINGWPCHRIAVCLTAPGGTTVPIPASLYFFEEGSGAWYRVGPAGMSLTSGVVTFFDTVGLLEMPSAPSGVIGQTPVSAVASMGVGSNQVYLVLSDPGAGAANGTYVVSMGPDLTTAAGDIPGSDSSGGANAVVIQDPTTVANKANVRTVGSVNALEEDLATLIAGEDLTNNRMRVIEPAAADSTDAWTNYASAAVVGTAGINIKASPGRLRQIRATNKSTTVQYWLLIVNKASAPVANDLPVWAIELPALTAAGVKADGDADFGPAGLYLSAGLSYALSTTSDKVTLAASADAMVYAKYA